MADKQKKVKMMRRKFLVLGEKQCGKTCLLNYYRWIHARSTPSLAHTLPSLRFSSTYTPTCGVDLVLGTKPEWRKVDNTEVRVVSSFLDMSGDGFFLKVRSEFYSDFQGVLLVFDVTDKGSFKRLEIWLKEVAKFASIDPSSRGNANLAGRCVVVGTKCDKRTERVVSVEDARTWAMEKGFDYYDVSAQSGQGVTLAIDALCAKTNGDTKISKFQIPSFIANTPENDIFFNDDYKSSSSSSSSSSSERRSSMEHDNKYASSSTTATSNEDMTAMTTKEIRNELRRLHVNYDDCLERADYVKRLEEARSNKVRPTSTNRTSSMDAKMLQRRKSDRKAAQTIATAAEVKKEVELWTRGKDIISLINALNEQYGGEPLKRGICTTSEVTKAYRKVLLRIHPDKNTSGDERDQVKATEIFKIVNEKYEEYRAESSRPTTAKSRPSSGYRRPNARKTRYG